MTTFSRTLALIGLLLAALVATGRAQGDDPRRAAEIKETETELEKSRSRLEEANAAVQELYSTFAALTRRLAAGQDPATREDIERVLEPSFEAAVAAAAERSSSGRIRSLFEKSWSKGTARAETDFVKTVATRLREVAVEKVSDHGPRLADVSLAEFADEVVGATFPEDRPFARLWNDTIADRRAEVARYVEARAELTKLEQQLMVLRDPKLAFTIGAPEGMARIEARSVRVESEYGFARKTRNGKVKTFFIDLCEVTHGSYWRDFYATLDDAAQKATFLPRDENDAPLWFQEPTSGEFQPDPSLMNLPVTGIDAVAALAYAKKQGKRLPTEAEWLAAAAGHKSRSTDYAWGDDFDPMRCNAKESGVGAAVAVTELPIGRSYFGLYHVCGNVKEWTATTEEGKDFDDAVPAGEALAIRGGSFKETARNVTLKWRWVLPGTGSRLTDVGFRCAKDVF